MIEISQNPLTAYFEGMRQATIDWAWWKDGTQYVGSCGTTLEKALNEINILEKNQKEVKP